MNHPTLEQVEAADRFQLCKWHRFLPTGETKEQIEVQHRIHERYLELGGMTTQISKLLGWERQ